MTSTDEATPAATARAVLGIAAIAEKMGRGDIGGRLRIAAARAGRPATIVCVVGEFKQGKSSLVNALIGTDICPVDDDLATSAMTLIHHGADVEVTVRRRQGEQSLVEQIDAAAITSWVTEAGNPDNAKGVERVEISVPSALLADGLVFVDTPGMGGLGAGHAAATLAFLPFADGLVFVSDASAELSQPEVAFLDQARDACPNVLFALTKADLYQSWSRIRALDIAHLEQAGVKIPTLAVSSQLRSVAVARGDSALDQQSGIPALLDVLDSEIVSPAKHLAARRAAIEAMGALDLLDASVAGELDALADPQRGAAIAAEADTAKQRLDHLRGPGARWTIVVGDRVTDVSSDVSFRFRDGMRKIVRNIEEEIEQLKTAKEWDDLSRVLQTQVAEAVTEAFVRLETGAAEIRDAVLELLAQDMCEVTLPSFATPIDVSTFWSSKPIDVRASRGGKVVGEALTGLRGAQSGIIMFGMMSQFLPAGIGVLLASNPVTLGLGAVFGGMQLAEAQKRKVAQRRQQARTNARQFSDDVQFEVGNTIGEIVRAIQRSIRDEFTQRIAELHETYAETARAATESIARDSADRTRRTELLHVFSDQLAQQRAALDAAVGAFA